MIQIVAYPLSILNHDRPGMPTTVELGGTSFNTTDPAPTLELRPMVMEPSTLAPEEMSTLSSIVGMPLSLSLYRSP